ncbi:MAG: hypothetical protein AB1491_09145 [Thermodesulfobacteriota bacterium]
MAADWQLIAFPVILPWREEFWTLPLYFPQLKTGVITGWPPGLPYQGIPLPAEALAPARELAHYHLGELSQWKAFAEYKAQQQDEVEEIIKALRGEPPEAPAVPVPSGEAWSLAWQLEKMQADQEAQMLQVDRGQEWLAEILSPEPWVQRVDFGPVPGIKEMVDPELARLRYLLWRREMGPYLQDPWAPFLLGRSSQAIFASLKEEGGVKQTQPVQISLPGCRSQDEWRKVRGEAGSPGWLGTFQEMLAECLGTAAKGQDVNLPAQKLNRWLEEVVALSWPVQPMWRWGLEVWAVETETEAWQPVLSWAGAGGDIMPG